MRQVGAVGRAEVWVDDGGERPVVVVRDARRGSPGDNLTRQLACLLAGVRWPRGTVDAPPGVQFAPTHARYEYRIPWDREAWERVCVLVDLFGQILVEAEGKGASTAGEGGYE